MSWVATFSDFKAFGLPAECWSPPSRQIQSVTVSGSLFELQSHGFSGGESVRIAARGTGSAVPTGLAASSFYTVAPPPNPDFFTLVAVSISDIGTGVLVALENMLPVLAQILAARTSFVIACAKAYAGPWTTPPAWTPQTVCELAALDFHAVLRTSSPLYDVDQVQKKFDAAMAFCLDVLNKGVPMPDGTGPIDATPTKADNGAALAKPRSGPFRAPREPPGLTGPFGATGHSSRYRV